LSKFPSFDILSTFCQALPAGAGAGAGAADDEDDDDLEVMAEKSLEDILSERMDSAKRTGRA